MAIRSPMELLTSVPEAERRAVGRGERIELPTGVTLPAAVMAALRQPPEGTHTAPRLQVLGMLESPAEVVREVAPRALRMANAAERVMLVTVEETPPLPDRIEVGRPFVPTAVARADTPVATRRAELVQAERVRTEIAQLRAEAGLPPVVVPERTPAMRSAIAASIREDLRTPTLAPERVARLVAEGRLDPKTFGWVGGTAKWSQALGRPELGAFVPDFSLTGV